MSVTLQMIAVKTNNSKSWMAWIPILNLYLIYKIANKRSWFFLLIVLSFINYFAPRLSMIFGIINLILGIIIWVKIAQARQKPGWLGLLMLLPVFNFIVMGYLAFSNGSTKEQTKPSDTSSKSANNQNNSVPPENFNSSGQSEVPPPYRA